MADLQVLNAAIARVAKKAYRLPLSTPTYCPLQSRENAGMGVSSLMLNYVQLNTKYLIRALNDRGPLGMTTRALLARQHAKVAGMQNMGKAFDRPRLQKETRHLHLIKQISLLKEAGMEATGTDDTLNKCLQLGRCGMVDGLFNAGYDPLGLGMRMEIPPNVYLPLLELGLDSLEHLVQTEAGNKIMIQASHLQRVRGGLVTIRHNHALNQSP